MRAETLIVLSAFYMTLCLNGPLWTMLLGGRGGSQYSTAMLGVLAFIALCAIQFFVLAALSPGRLLRPVLTLFLVVAAATHYYMDRFGVILDPNMMRNALHTNSKEVGELLGSGLLAEIFLFAVLPSGVVWGVTLSQWPRRRAILARAATLFTALAVAVAAILANFQALSSAVRNHREVRFMVNPVSTVWSTARAFLFDVHEAILQRAPPDPAARLTTVSADNRPALIVIVVGETVRAANFGIAGYARDTTPNLARVPLINFSPASACGTSTEVSLPCMFSPFGRTDYDEDEIRRHDSLLHVLARAGVGVLWRDNQSGCKGVCEGLPVHDMSKSSNRQWCKEAACYDEVLLEGLDEVVDEANSDLVVVLHPLGNHGPSYFRRYPDAYRRFLPACEFDDLRQCTHEEIVNAYDNAITYSDHVLSRVIGFLKGWQSRRAVAMMYVSDHGESLGEYGLYLHGMPYRIAPPEQLKVPMFWWMPPESAGDFQVDLTCFSARGKTGASHDNVYHSIVGLLNISTPRYRSGRDLFSGCRMRSKHAYSHHAQAAQH